MYNSGHMMGMFALGLTFTRSKVGFNDQIIKAFINGQEIPVELHEALEKAGEELKSKEFQSMLKARQLQRLVNEFAESLEK